MPSVTIVVHVRNKFRVEEETIRVQILVDMGVISPDMRISALVFRSS